MIEAKIVGMASLERKFRALEKVAQGKMLEQALVAGALLVQNEWKTHTPYRTGTYRRSIHIGGHTDLAPGFEGTDIGKQSGSDSGASVIVGTSITDPPYPIFLEKGTSKMVARSSCGPAFDAKKDAAVKEIGEAFKDLLKKAT